MKKILQFAKESNYNSIQEIINDFERQIIKDIQDDGVNGSISSAIVKNNKIIWLKAFGVSNVDENTLADANTIYRAGSITKSFTAFLMMQLVQKGMIDLSDPVEKYLPEIKNLRGYSDSTKVTFLQLANHTSGLERGPQLKDAGKGPIQEWENKILESIPKTSFSSNPGEKSSYSNIGFGILGLALSRAANQSFTNLIEKEIFEPLNMENSYFIVPDTKTKNLSKGMDGGPLGKINLKNVAKEHSGRGYKVPNGGIYSTPNDLAKFMICNMGYSKILEQEKLELMQIPKTPQENESNYGLGFSLYEDSTFTTVGQGGSVLGYTANFLFEREFNYGVIIMRNCDWGLTNLKLRSNVLLRKCVELERKNLI